MSEPLKPTMSEDPWWEMDDEDAWQGVQDATKRISSRTKGRRLADMHHAELYGNMQLAGVSPRDYDSMSAEQWVPSTLSFNIVARNVDAIVAKTAKNRPVPTFLTQKGKPEDQERAEKLNKFVIGMFYETKQYAMSHQICRDACTFGTGIQANFVRGGKPRIERVFPWELRIDPHEAMYGTPRVIYQYRWVDRRRLARRAMATDKKLGQWILDEATAEQDDDSGFSFTTRDTTADQLLVKEAWVLPTEEGAKDGKWIACVEGKTIDTDVYEEDYFPFSTLHYKNPLIGWYGTGVAQELQGIQFELNAMAEKIQEGFLMTGSYWWLSEGSKVMDSHIQQGLGTIVRTSGGDAPVKYDPPSINQDQMQYLQFLLGRGPQEVGSSELSINAQKPAGLNSGKALETFNDIESENFQMFGRAYEDFHLDVAKQQIALAKKLDGYTVRSVTGKRIQILSLKDASIDETQFVMQCFPTSFLANTPSDRFQQVQDLANAGYITPDQAKELLQFPDVESEADLDGAPHRVLNKWLSDMAESGTPRMPEPFMNLGDAMLTALKWYWKCQDDERDEATLDLFRTFINQVKQLQDEQKANAAAQSQTATPGALMPGGVVAPGAPVPQMPSPAQGPQ